MGKDKTWINPQTGLLYESVEESPQTMSKAEFIKMCLDEFDRRADEIEEKFIIKNQSVNDNR